MCTRVQALLLMQSQQKGHDNSGFAMVMQDLGGIFAEHKHLPTLSMACTDEGLKIAEDMLHAAGFQRCCSGSRKPIRSPGLDINAMPNYVFETFDYPKQLQRAPRRRRRKTCCSDMRLQAARRPGGG